MGDPSIAVSVTTFASGKVGQQVDKGECYDLAHAALTGAGAKSAPDYGTITDDADYVWGKKVALATAQAGDVLQLRNHKFKVATYVKVTTTKPNGAWDESTSSSEEEQSRPHHTAIVTAKSPDGSLLVYEQNVVPPGGTVVSKNVQKNKLIVTGSTPPKKTETKVLADGTKIVTETTVKITVSGTVWVYRPEKK